MRDVLEPVAGHISHRDGEAVSREVPGLHLVAVGRRLVHHDAAQGERPRPLGELRGRDPARRLQGDGLRGDRALVLHPGETGGARIASQGAGDGAARVEGGQVRLGEPHEDVRSLPAGRVRGDLLDDEVLGPLLEGARRSHASS
jgi:hypothetical protein